MFSNLPPVTRSLILANIVAFLLQTVSGDTLIAWFALWPIGMPSEFGSGIAGFQPWQLITYAFLHGSVTHIFFNMFALYMFGADVERVFGARRYLEYYVVCVVVAGITQLLVSLLIFPSTVPTVGASGGLFGVLLAFGMYFPNRRIILLIPPIPMPARVFVAIYGALELFFGVTQTDAGVAHFAHLGGMLGGYLMLRVWRR